MKSCPACGEVMILTQGKHGGFYWCPNQRACGQKTISEVFFNEPVKVKKKKDKEERPFAWVDDLTPVASSVLGTYDPDPVDRVFVEDEDSVLAEYNLYEDWMKYGSSDDWKKGE